MKYLLLTVFMVLFTCKVLAQESIEIKDAKRYAGKRVAIEGYVSDIRVFNPSSVRVTICSSDLAHKVIVVLKGKGASRGVWSLHRNHACSEGVITMKGKQPMIYTTTKNLMALLKIVETGFNCIEGDPQQTIIYDTVKRSH